MKRSMQEINEEVERLENDPLHNVEFLLEATAAHLRDLLYFQGHPLPEWTKGLPDTTRHMIKILDETRRDLRKDVAKRIFPLMKRNLGMIRRFRDKVSADVYEAAVRTDIKLLETVLGVSSNLRPRRSGLKIKKKS